MFRSIVATVANDVVRWTYGTSIQFHERCAYDIASPDEMEKRALQFGVGSSREVYALARPTIRSFERVKNPQRECVQGTVSYSS